MRPTTAFEKLLTSAINVLATLLVSFLFYPFIGSSLYLRLLCILSFFILNFLFLLIHNKAIGMMIIGSHFEREPELKEILVYCILYSISFSSLLFYIFIPFDIFVLNMLLIQLPTVKKTGTTLHGVLAGNLRTIKIKISSSQTSTVN